MPKSSNLESISWREWWMGLYAIGCILIPPIHFHEKYFYAAEYLLLPILIALFVKALRGEVSWPPKILCAVLGATVLAFFSGWFRGKIGVSLSVYDWFTEDQFSLGKDGISFVRWSVTFATPWIASEVFKAEIFKAPRSTPLAFFWRILKFAILIAGVLSVLDHFHWINLTEMGYNQKSKWWVNRSYGTQASPLEGSIIFGALALFVFDEMRRDSKKDFLLNVFALVASMMGMFFTQSLTAIVAFLLVLALFTGTKKNSVKKRLFFFGVVAILTLVFNLTFPNFLGEKIGDLTTRTLVWIRYLKLLGHKPWFFFTGIGFSGVVVDNSFFLLFIKGGALLLVSVFIWMKKLYLLVPESLRLPAYFWLVTFLALDSIGYWALGRVMWFSLGLCYASRLVTDKELKTRNSVPRGSTPS